MDNLVVNAGRPIADPPARLLPLTAGARHVIEGVVYDADYGDYDVRNGDSYNDVNNSLDHLLRRCEGQRVRVTFEVLTTRD